MRAAALRGGAAVVALTLACSLGLTACQRGADTIDATGRVLADNVTVQAPALDVPGISGGMARVVSVQVRLGDEVKAGEVLARFDDAVLAARVALAKRDAAVAKAQVKAIDAAIDTTHDSERDLRGKRREVTDGIAKATRARKELVKKLAEVRESSAKLPRQLATVEKNLRELKPKLAEVEKNLAELKPKLAGVEQQLAEVTRALDELPPDAPPGVREQLEQAKAQLTAAKTPLTAGIKQLTAARTQLTAGIKQLTTARGTIKAGVEQLKKGEKQLTKGLATIDTNVRKARDGLKKIDDGLRKIADARAGLKRARTLAVIAAADTTGVDAANVAKRQAVVRAPSDGVITAIAQAGAVLAPGATVATIARPATVVTTWLAPEEVADVCVGDAATVALGSLPAPASGRLSRILPGATYPPSYHTTDRVHLTRAVPVEITVDAALPPGVPADIRLTPCRTRGD